MHNPNYDVGLSLPRIKLPRISIPKIHLPKFIKTLGSIAFAPFLYLALKPLAFVGKQMLKILSRMIGSSTAKVADRRAKHIAWSRRRSKVPTKNELKESAVWTNRYLKSQGAIGKIALKFHKAKVKGDIVGAVDVAAISAALASAAVLLKIFVDMAAKQGAPASPRQPPPESPQASIPEPQTPAEVPQLVVPEETPAEAPAEYEAPAEASGAFKSGLAVMGKLHRVRTSWKEKDGSVYDPGQFSVTYRGRKIGDVYEQGTQGWSAVANSGTVVDIRLRSPMAAQRALMNWHRGWMQTLGRRP